MKVSTIVTFMAFAILLSVTNSYSQTTGAASKEDIAAAKKLDVEHTEDQILATLPANLPSAEREYSTNRKDEYTSKSLYITYPIKRYVPEDDEYEVVDVEIYAINPNPIKNKLCWKIEGLFKKDLRLLIDGEKIPLSKKQRKNYLKALEEEFEKQKQLVLQTRTDLQKVQSLK